MSEQNYNERVRGGREEPSRLRSILVAGVSRVGEAFRAVSTRSIAGKAEMDYVLLNPNSKEANKLKDGSPQFFFGAADDDVVPYLRWSGDMFHNRERPHRGKYGDGEHWDRRDCAVLVYARKKSE